MLEAMPTTGAAPGPHRVRWIGRTVLFLCVFWALQSAWESVRGGPIEHWVVHDATVVAAAQIIDRLTPAIEVEASGATLLARGGGLRVLRGCEGVEAWFLLLAALTAAPMRWRRRITGMLFGTALVYVVNQLRIVALFYLYRLDRDLFAAMHGAVAPLLVVVIVGLFFRTWLHRSGVSDAAA
jgi:exosortase family protein XrtM